MVRSVNIFVHVLFFFSSRRRHTRCALVTGVQTCALPICTYGVSFGREYFIPKPFDPRLIVRIAVAVAKAAMESGVATRPMSDLDAYAEQLQHFVYHSGAFMKPLFSSARQLVRDGGKARIVFTEGEEEQIGRAHV